MPERFGLFVIVVLGEAVLAVVNGVEASDWSAGAVVAAVAGFAIAASVWWIYFDQFDESAIDRAIQGGRGAQVRSFLYGYGHLLIYGSVVGAGVAVELSAEEAAHGGEPVPLLGLSLAALMAGFFVISTGVGRSASRTVMAAKVALAALGVALTLSWIGPALAVALIAAGWLGLVLLELALPAARSEPAEELVPG